MGATSEVPPTALEAFSPTTYTGTGAAQTITNGIDLAGKGGLVWIKSRSNIVDNFLFDTTRGVNVEINSNKTDANATLADSVTAFNSNGFTIGNVFGIGSNTSTFASWTFRKGLNFFDIVTYTGNGGVLAVNHNLGTAPKLIIIKRTDAASDWGVYVTQDSPFVESALLLNSNAAQYSGGVSFTSSTTFFRVFGTGFPMNNSVSGANYVAYLFGSLAGVSKVGAYTGTGTPQTINCGFSNGARFILIKRTDAAGNWYIWDTARGIIAGNDPVLVPNTTAAEPTLSDAIDPNSSGFVVNQVASLNTNVSGATYIYLAIA